MMKRRRFLEWFVKLCSVLIAALLSLPVIRFLFASNIQRQQAVWYPLLKLDPNTFLQGPTQVRIRRVVRDGWLTEVTEEFVWISKKKDGEFLVFSSHCTHLGCLVSWDQKSNLFLCPCHGGKFDENGNRVAGPPPRPLDRYETKIENNTLLIKV
jgi:menaquinol-cytochrome c reductase iron-sulfur subunit